MIFLHILSAAQINAVLVELIDQYGITNVLDALDGWTPNCQEDIDILKRELEKMKQAEKMELLLGAGA